MRHYAYISSALIIAALSALTGCGNKHQGQMQMPTPNIPVMTVSTGSTENETSYPATIKGKTDIAIRPQVTGFITKVHVDEGQQVHAGQVLFTLDQVQFQAAVEQAEAAVNSAKTAVNTAQLTTDNKKKLFEKNIISAYEYQLSQNDLATAKAALSQAEASLTTARKNLAYTVVTSPSNGVVGSIPNREGSLASPSSVEPLTTVSENSQVYAYFSLTEKELLELAADGASTINAAVASMPDVKLRLSDGTIYPISGKVATVSGVIDQTTGAATVRAIFNNNNGMLRSGSTGTVIIPVHSENVIVIPQSATSEMQDRRFAYVVNDSNKVVSVPITVTPLSDGKNFIVNSGLNAGDRIALEGIGTKVRDGAVINPIDPAQAAAAAQQAGMQQH